MNKLTAILTPCLLCLFLIGEARAQNFVVVPGVSVGDVRLGDARTAVLKRMGKPTKTSRPAKGLVRDEWLGAEPPDLSGEMRLFLVVTYRASKAAQIEFNSPRFETADGFSVRDTLAQFRRRYGRTRTAAFGYEDFVGYYYDATRRGLTFMVGIQDYFDDRVRATSLIVHPPGAPVIPDAGGTPAKPNDEVPHGTLERVLSGS